ncbi:MAG: hypothetical protein K2Q29_12045 [Sphingomonadales bacterium]|jgi:hypothetical protein|nr:hypothetical protein [Sphingomonadales bacterium]
MSKPENPAERGPDTRTDGTKGPAKDAQLEGNRRPDRDLPRGAEGDTRRASGMPR